MSEDVPIPSAEAIRAGKMLCKGSEKIYIRGYNEEGWMNSFEIAMIIDKAIHPDKYRT